MSTFAVSTGLCPGLDGGVLSMPNVCAPLPGLQMTLNMSQGFAAPVPQMMWAGTGQQQDLGCLMPTVGIPYHLGHVMSQHNPPSQQQQQQQQGTTIFFAGVTPIADASQLLSVFAQFGRVMDLNLFRPYKGCRTSKGCGLVVFSQPCEAAAALEALHGRYVWAGARSPMIIEWCDPSKQHKRKRAQPLAPALLQQALAYQQPCMHAMMPTMMHATPISLGYMPNGNAGRLMMPGL